jgi:hypothetical protein
MHIPSDNYDADEKSRISQTYLKKYSIFMRVLSSFTKACIALAMYTATFDLAVPVCSLTYLFKSC